MELNLFRPIDTKIEFLLKLYNFNKIIVLILIKLNYNVKNLLTIEKFNDNINSDGKHPHAMANLLKGEGAKLRA